MATMDKTKPTKEPQLIWDLPLRLFHWAMVLVVCVAAITGYFFEEMLLEVHVYAGYLLACLISFRLVWGIVGSHYSRFHTYPLKRSHVKSHLKQLSKGRSQTYSGHNPVGAWMIVILLSCLTLLVLTGLTSWGGQDNQGPFAGLVTYQLGDMSEEVHEVFANILITAIAIHIAGVCVETFIFKHPLIRAMITGYKDNASPQSPNRNTYTVRGSLVFTLIIAGVVYWGLMAPAQSMTDLTPLLQTYEQEAKATHPEFKEFSAERGKSLFLQRNEGGKPDTPSCTSCHTKSPHKTGETRAGKSIAPMALSLTPTRYADQRKVEKWFRRNCTGVMGRPCTALEKGDFLTFMTTQ